MEPVAICAVCAARCAALQEDELMGQTQSRRVARSSAIAGIMDGCAASHGARTTEAMRNGRPGDAWILRAPRAR